MSASMAADGGGPPASPNTGQGPAPTITAPALSILASALSPSEGNSQPSVQSVISSVLSEANSILHPSAPPSEDPAASAHTEGQSSATSIVATLRDQPCVVLQKSGHVVVGSATLSVGQQTTVSGVPIMVYSSALLIGSTFVPLPLEPSSSSEATACGTRGDQLPLVVESPSASAAYLPPVTTASASSSRGVDPPAATTVKDGVHNAALRCQTRRRALVVVIGVMLVWSSM